MRDALNKTVGLHIRNKDFLLQEKQEDLQNAFVKSRKKAEKPSGISLPSAFSFDELLASSFKNTLLL